MLEDPLLLARLQFALTAGTHYMFVALTLGLAPFILLGQLRATLARDEARMRAVRFWGGLYLVNYGMGVLSGLVMELQLATNWAGLNDMFGYAFSAPLAVETMAAFFIESTFLGLWIFGWDRMGRWSHLACFLVVTATAYASAYWVLVANGFLKNEVVVAQWPVFVAILAGWLWRDAGLWLRPRADHAVWQGAWDAAITLGSWTLASGWGLVVGGLFSGGRRGGRARVGVGGDLRTVGAAVVAAHVGAGHGGPAGRCGAGRGPARRGGAAGNPRAHGLRPGAAGSGHDPRPGLAVPDAASASRLNRIFRLTPAGCGAYRRVPSSCSGALGVKPS